MTMVVNIHESSYINTWRDRNKRIKYTKKLIRPRLALREIDVLLSRVVYLQVIVRS